MAARHGLCIDCAASVTGGASGPIPQRCASCRRKQATAQAVACYVWVAYRRVCVDCQHEYEVLGHDTKSTRCVDCRSARRAEIGRQWNVANPEKVAEAKLKHFESSYAHHPTKPATCQDCGSKFVALRKGNDKLRCPGCDIEARRETHRDVLIRRRARLASVRVEEFRREDVFLRDGYSCQLCGLQLDPLTRFPDDASATLDHVIPLSRGGEHSMRNTQCACWRCNRLKNARMPGEVAVS